MFPITITLKNYRCFSATNPAQIQVRPGFTALVGQNNSGKSALLRFFYELRGVFNTLSNPNHVRDLISNTVATSFQGTEDSTEVYFGREQDSQDLIIDLDFPVTSEDQLSRARLVFQRASPNVLRTSYYLGPHRTHVTGLQASGGSRLVLIAGSSQHSVDVQPFIETMQSLAGSVYIGAFRNAIHEGAGSLYDLPIGTSFINRLYRK